MGEPLGVGFMLRTSVGRKSLKLKGEDIELVEQLIDRENRNWKAGMIEKYFRRKDKRAITGIQLEEDEA